MNDANERIEMTILPPVRDLGDGFQVRRALPSAKRRMVGPFIFFDQMGPTALQAGHGLDVRPHPHIGLATVTYLLQGEIVHRDSLGSIQTIRPGEINWMTAGRGIAHSERTGPELRSAGSALFGLQIWIALPTAHEETDPGFSHHKAESLPEFEETGQKTRLIAGSLFGRTSPVPTFSDMVYADIALTAGTQFPVPADHVERAIYVVSGSVEVAGQDGRFEPTQLVVFKPGAEIVLRAAEDARLMLIGGEPFPEKRHIFWNFVSSSPDRIEQAKRDWRESRFAPVPGETEFIPLPDDPPGVRYP
ncbi:MAG: pirin family protein [Alphaproteobacteria bacterium]